MGWTSGTELFDVVYALILPLSISRRQKIDVIKQIIDAFENRDWDGQDDSRYRDDPIMKAAMIQLHPDWENEE